MTDDKTPMEEKYATSLCQNFRRTNSILAQQGLSLPLLQRRLGHSTPRVTMAVYSHAGAEEGVAAPGYLAGC